jgi:hypothetical protein
LRDVLRAALLALSAPVAFACGGVDEQFQPLDAIDAGVESEVTAAQARCADSERQPDPELSSAFNVAKAQWHELGSANYTVKVRRMCFCAPLPEDHVKVTVAGGRIRSAFGRSESGAYDLPIAEAKQRDWYTVTGLFERIEANLMTADRIDAVFDPERGYPNELLFDYQMLSGDEGEYFQMWEFTPLPSMPVDSMPSLTGGEMPSSAEVAP